VGKTASWCIGGCWYTLALHPIHEIPELDFLDGVLVGARSLRLVLGHSSWWNSHLYKLLIKVFWNPQ